MLKDLNEEDINWWKGFLEYTININNYTVAAGARIFFVNEPILLECVERGYFNFSMEIEKNNSIWFYAEEFGSPEEVGAAVNMFFKATNKTKPWGFTWAITCDKLRVDEFDGGAILVKRGKVSVFSGNNFLRKKMVSN